MMQSNVIELWPQDRAKLFSSASLVTVLQDRYQWAIRTYIGACGEWHWRELIDAVVERATPHLLDFDLSAKPASPRTLHDGRCVTAISFTGDQFLWYLSPVPLEVSYTVETDKGFRLGEGSDGGRLGFEIAGGELLLFCSMENLTRYISWIHDTLVQQWQAIWGFEQALNLHLRSLARPPEV